MVRIEVNAFLLTINKILFQQNHLFCLCEFPDLQPVKVDTAGDC
jgi:hypothetical protein